MFCFFFGLLNRVVEAIGILSDDTKYRSFITSTMHALFLPLQVSLFVLILDEFKGIFLYTGILDASHYMRVVH